jgi:hypothetical protein
MADTFQVDMENFVIKESELLTRYNLIIITRKQVETLERRLDQYLLKGVKNKANFKACIRKKQLEILRLKSVLKYIDTLKE